MVAEPTILPLASISPLKVEIPETLDCLANNVEPVTVTIPASEDPTELTVI